MPVPKKRVSRARRDLRRAHDFLTRTYAIICPSCGEPVLRHRVCMSCGQYRGKQVIQNKAETQAATSAE
jgi:large subunit ribosomal protein L32